ncbi:MAG: oligosaccharide flippase family protein, partial [bacterium]|nr:oligosaccharide flippase family protein [bacterium]
MPEEQAAVNRIVKGAIQTLGSAYTARLINFGVLILLTNILVPGDFGTIEMAFSLLALVVAIRDLGLHYALIHEHDRVHELAPTHFVLSVGLGAISTVLAILMAFFYEDATTAVQGLDAYLKKDVQPTDPKPMVAVALLVFAVFDLLKTAALTAETQLRRDLAFGRLAFAHASATIFAALLGLLVAYFGGGRWALILGFFPYSAGYVTLFCTVVWLKCPPPLHRLKEFNRQAARRMIAYGLWFWIGGVPKVFILHFDKLVIGFLINLEVRGLYDTAHRFAQMPTGAITLAIVGITGAVYARYQNNRDQLSAAYRRTLRLILRTTVPISC